MNIANSLIEKLPLFINELRRVGYNISTAQFIAVQNLIFALAKQGKLPPKLAQFNTLLAPILCHTQKEQQAFGSHFDDWVQTIEKFEEISCPDENAISDTLPPKKIRSTKKWVIITTVIVIAMLIGGLVFYQFFPRVQETPPTETTDVSEPPPSSPEPVLPEPETTPESQLLELPKPQKPQTYFWWILLVLLLPLFLLLKYLWRRGKRRYLGRKYASIQPDIQKLSVETVEKNIFQPANLSHSAQQLRKHISVESIHFDITATIDKSIEAGGWFTPVRGTMKRRPEYLVLIDRLTFKDHQTKLVDTLVQQLIDEEVLVNRYYFDATPRRCYPEDKHLAPLTLTELAAHHPAHKLLIFSDGNGFINPITGKIVDWIHQLSIWTHRTLFTLEAPEQWGYREHLLKEDADFLIMPANEGGLKFLVEQINANARQSYHSTLWQNGRKNLAFPEVLNENFNRWLERHAPDAEILAELLTQVKLFLGEKAYYWFCACAVYPELHWQVTLYLRKELLTESEPLEDFMKLARLPWFRYGYMPDWLREPLVEELTAQQKDKAVHATLEKLLETIGLDKNSEAFLKIAREQSKRLTKHNPLKEQVFLEFMADKLAVKAPKNLRKLLVDSFKLPTMHTVWKITKVTTVVFLIITFLILGALEVKDYYIKEQERLAEEQAKIKAEQERLDQEEAEAKRQAELRKKQEEAQRQAELQKKQEEEAQRQTELQKKQEIASLLQDCEKHLKADRLTTGRGGTAFDCYQTVLKREPNNIQAKEGLAKIEARYLGLIEKSFNNNDIDKVNRYIERVRKVNPNSEIFAEIEKRYVDLIKKAWQENKSDEVDAYLLLVRKVNPKSEIFAEIESLRQTEEQRLVLAKEKAIIKLEQERLVKEKAKLQAEQERLAKEKAIIKAEQERLAEEKVESIKPQYIQLDQREAGIIGQKIWMNEGSAKEKNLTVWNKGENFASMGIAHFIWYPPGQEGPYQETFPDLIFFLQHQGSQFPLWLLNTPDAPWDSYEAFQRDKQSAEMEELRTLLINTIPQQVQFMITRLEKNLPKMQTSLPPERRNHLVAQFYRVVQAPNGIYALLDYVNFKGEGTKFEERYRSEGWGLLQVLENMSGNSPTVMLEFVQSAESVLRRRIQNAPSMRNESRWLSGWINRIKTYNY